MRGEREWGMWDGESEWGRMVVGDGGGMVDSKGLG